LSRIQQVSPSATPHLRRVPAKATYITWTYKNPAQKWDRNKTRTKSPLYSISLTVGIPLQTQDLRQNLLFRVFGGNFDSLSDRYNAEMIEEIAIWRKNCFLGKVDE